MICPKQSKQLFSKMVITLPSGAAVAAAKKKAAAAKAKKPKATLSSHPRAGDMVDAAIAALKEKGGSSLAAIKSYISATYNVDAEKLSPLIKKHLKSSATKGTAGSFKLASATKASPKRKRSPAKKPAGATKKKSSPKKKASPKKKVPKALAAKPPKPKVSKPKAAKKVSTKAKKPASKAKKARK